MPDAITRHSKRWFVLSLFCLSGAAVYTYPFLRFSYYDTMREALNLTHTQMGVAQGMYGIVSVLGYIVGGWLADRYSARKLISLALISTGLSGFYFSTFPSYSSVVVLYGFWGISTLVIFWAPLIKATRELGSKSEQGRLFGFLEGGRGLIGTIIGFITLTVFTTMGEGSYGLMWVINISAVMTIVAGLAVWFFLADSKPPEKTEAALSGIKQAIKMPQTWVMGLIIFCGYSLFAGQTYTTPYMTGIIGVSISFGALMGLIRTYALQIVGGPVFGVIADKIGSPTKVIIGLFIVTTITFGLFLIIPPTPAMLGVVTANMIALGFCVYGLRGNYFATVGESETPQAITGSVIGVASFIGFLPEAFLYPLVGHWLDTYPGVTGYRITFAFLMGISLLGIIAGYVLLRMNRGVGIQTQGSQTELA